jgi:hypothetical protein
MLVKKGKIGPRDENSDEDERGEREREKMSMLLWCVPFCAAKKNGNAHKRENQTKLGYVSGFL